MNHRILHWQVIMDDIHPLGCVTGVDVGTPPYDSQDWETFTFYFHGFETLSAKKGHRVQPRQVSCFRDLWAIGIHPGGETSASGGNVSINANGILDIDGSRKNLIKRLEGIYEEESDEYGSSGYWEEDEESHFCFFCERYKNILTYKSQMQFHYFVMNI